jgi:hypothetical protein
LLTRIQYASIFFTCPASATRVRITRPKRGQLHTIDTIIKAGAGFKSPRGRLVRYELAARQAHADRARRLLAEFERSPSCPTRKPALPEHRERAVTFGRPLALNAEQRRLIAERYAAGKKSMAELASESEVGEATVWRVLRGARDLDAHGLQKPVSPQVSNNGAGGVRGPGRYFLN